MGRLTAAVVGLLSFGLITGTAAMVLFLQGRLIQQIDEQLATTAQAIGTVALEQVRSGDPESSPLPSDHYLFLQDATYGQREWISPSTHELYGYPRLEGYEYPIATRENPQPATVPNAEEGAPWRVITIATRSPGSPAPTGIMTIGLPLRSVDSTLSVFLQRVLMVDLLVITLGALIGSLVVTRAVRPLRQIEVVAGRIAAGDLTQRVPQALPPTTEVGSLARSLNMMLAHIERSFAHRQASERRMRRFVSDASHELRTPLATVRGYGELYRLGGIPGEELPRAMGRIESEATRMSGLVNDLLPLARLDEERALNLDEVDLVVLAGDAVADLRALDSSRRVAVVGLSDEQVGPVLTRADSDQLRQVLTNLMGNVVQHTPAGTPVELAVGYSRDAAVIEVRDHGAGVAPQDLQRVFGRFFRTDVSRSRESGGTGLGLAIVAAIVAAHGGTTRALPTEGGGLTVRVELPCPDRAPTEKPNRAGHRNGRGDAGPAGPA
nr:HAMP domain-containing histidine kinase [Actinomycetales bacterium]